MRMSSRLVGPGGDREGGGIATAARALEEFGEVEETTVKEGGVEDTANSDEEAGCSELDVDKADNEFRGDDEGVSVVGLFIRCIKDANIF